MSGSLFHRRRAPTPARPEHAALRDALQTHEGPCLIAAVGHDVHTSRVLLTAVDLAVRLGAYLHVVHVIDLVDYPIDPDSALWEEQAQQELRRREIQVGEELAGSAAPWSYTALHGAAPAVLCELAEAHGPLMMVVGAGGRGLGGALERFTFGSPGTSLIHHCPSPVLVVPPTPSPHRHPHQPANR